jgi:L-iditol 2-dehydrogenase
MKAVVLTGIREMQLREITEPGIETDTQVVIRIERVGVCGSDVHYYTTGRIGSQVVEYPYTVGHEASGVIEQVGPAVDRLKVGDRVAIEPAMPCWQCDQCRAGRHHTCRNLRFLACPGQAEGCLSEFLVMPRECCFPIPDTLSLDRAALVEPLSIGVYSVKLSGILPEASIAVLGTGPIGLSVIVAARAAGVSRIYATDKIDARLEAALQAGAVWTGNPREGDIVEEIGDREPAALDMAFECCGQQEALDQAVRLLKPGGKLMIVGIPEVDRVSFDIDMLRRKEIAIQNVRRQRDCVQPALDLIAGGEVDLDFMITHHFPLERTREAFDKVAGYRDGVVKAMIDVGRS